MSWGVSLTCRECCRAECLAVLPPVSPGPGEVGSRRFRLKGVAGNTILNTKGKTVLHLVLFCKKNTGAT